MTTVILEKDNTVLVEEPKTSVVSATEVLTVSVENLTTNTVTVTSSESTYHTDNVVEHVVSGGTQGPPGIPGASTQFEYHVAGSSLGGNRAITLNSVGQAAYPDLTSADSFVLGLTTGSAVLGELVEVQISGTQTEPTWSWIPGGAVFVGSNGTLTQEPPVSGQTIIIGWAATPTKLVIEKQPPIYME